jgi:hypothetical protein
VAADELYEGPSCVLSAIDNRQYKRMLYAVLYITSHTSLKNLFAMASHLQFSCRKEVPTAHDVQLIFLIKMTIKMATERA